MDLMPENPIQEKKKAKVSVPLIIVLVLIVILIIAAVIIWMYAQRLQAQQFKVNIDGIQNTKASNEDGLFLIQEGKVYTSISRICPYIGYNYYPGGYKQFSEDKTKCYINNSKEIVTFASGSKEIVKYPGTGNSQPQTFEIDEEVILKGENLYISSQGLSRAFNLNINYYAENNTVIIQSLPYLTTYYEKKIPTARLEKSNFGEQVKFNNEKAILRNLIVCQDEGTALYGVELLNNDGTLSSVITPRYTQVEYMEGTEDFIVTTEDRKVGIIGSDGITKVKPDYDKIDIIDKNVGLYLVTNSNKQGVINSNGKIIIHQDYDSIGLNANSYNDINVTNRYLLFGNAIPVELNKKWGLIDKNGETILPIEYDGIGCQDVPDTGNRNTSAIVVIPDIKGIVVEVDSQNGDNGVVVRKYEIINSMGAKVTDAILDSVYSTTVADVTTYYVTVQNQAIDIVKYWYDQQSKQKNENVENNNESVQDNNVADNNEGVQDNNGNVDANDENMQDSNGNADSNDENMQENNDDIDSNDENM